MVLAFLIAPASGSGRTRRDQLPAGKIAVRRVGDTGAVVMPAGAVMVWRASGEIQVLRSDGTWSALRRLPVSLVDSVTPDETGVLVNAQDLADRSTNDRSDRSRRIILEVGADGRVQDRWVMSAFVVSLGIVHGRRWATTSDGLVELGPGGVVKKIMPVEFPARIATNEHGGPIICVDRNETKENARRPYCYSPEEPRWRAEGDWTDPPFTCGGFLIEQSTSEIVARDVASGKIVGRTPAGALDVTACERPGTLLVGATTLRALALPAFRQIWSEPVGHGRVSAIVGMLEHVLVFKDSGGPIRLTNTP